VRSRRINGLFRRGINLYLNSSLSSFLINSAFVYVNRCSSWHQISVGRRCRPSLIIYFGQLDYTIEVCIYAVQILRNRYIPFLPYSRNVDVCIERAVLIIYHVKLDPIFLKYFLPCGYPMDYLQRRDYFNQHVSIRIRHPVVRRNKRSTRLVLVVPAFSL
jgi:hypothetical protein